MKLYKKILLFSIFLLLILFLFYIHYDYTQKNPGGADSIPRWVGTYAWFNKGINPYSDYVSEQSQLHISGRLSKDNEDRQLFVYPFYVVIFYLPFIWLPFNIARAIWMILIEFSIIGMVVCSIKLYKWTPPIWLFTVSILLSLLMYNSIRTIILWQMAGLVAFLIIFSIWALREKKDILAGIALGLATIKPQMIFLIIPILVLWALRKRMMFVVSLGITLIILAGFSFVFEPNWLSEMVTQIKEYPNYTVTPSVLYIFTGFFPSGIGIPMKWILLIFFILWLLWEWKIVICKKENFDFAVALSLLITNVIVIRTATTNYLMMLPVFFYVFSIAEKKYGYSSYLPILFMQLLFFIATWVLFALTLDNGFETWPSYFPIPVFLFCSLIWIRYVKKEDLSLSGL